MIDCKICKNKGLNPKCPFCERVLLKIKRKTKTKMQKIIESRERERYKMNEKAYENFQKTNATGSGCSSFDADVRETHGDW